MLVKFVKTTTPRRGGPIYSLTLGRVYEVLGVSGDMYQLLNDDNGPYLYEDECFEVIDPTAPDFWQFEHFGSSTYAYPPSWAAPGFFERVDDEDPLACAQFWRDMEILYPWTFSQRREKRP
ncbi:hypothetical protein [Nannocystis punicea]|uniref:Uncharacterized protein n=1 Tax=Nannocystis punicea TaxID=2995304 RepID=A0ABY7H1L4_9BACT|nr:hypothetical protein [Nannocystis poenicansa]WAS93151.1 hypothetical protein O0S08_43870 [Nannocystis poenicansa]